MNFFKINLFWAICSYFSIINIQAQVANEQYSPNESNNRYFEIAKNLDIFATLFTELNAYYVDEINPNLLMKIAIDAMLESLDPYTNYIPEDEIEDYRTMTTGQYGGIGALVGQREGKTYILMPYKGFPAEQSNLKIGDQIISVDGIELDGKNNDDVSKLLKGQANTKVTLEVLRWGDSKTQKITIERANIKIGNIPYYTMLNEEVGYLQLTDFTSNASREMRKVLEDLKSQGATKIILDLRGNPGGLLNEAINICNLFIPKHSEVVSTMGKIEEWNKSYKANNAPFDLEIPLVVLIDNRSASASEIVAGVMQDYDRGVLVGRRTFGKGLVQTTRPLSYNSQMKITTAKYYIPSGRCIQEIDYSNRDENGDALKNPDSIRTEFKTINNKRIVFDGNGLDPDIEVEKTDLAPITNSLIEKSLIFFYANDFYAQNPNIVSPKEFYLSDTDYQNFVNWLADKKYDYTTDVEKNLEELEKAAKEEQYYQLIQTDLDALKTRVMHNKEEDLQNFKDEIKKQLEIAIVARYYNQKGQIEASLKKDKDIEKALSILDNMQEYESLLK